MEAFLFDPTGWVNCRHCERMCLDIQKIGVLTENELRPSSSKCISRGECVEVCPTCALCDNFPISRVLSEISHGKTMIIPATRAGNEVINCDARQSSE
jgi:polyferredoxin